MKKYLLTGALALLAFPALAAKVAVSPVVVRTSDSAQAAAIQLHNEGVAPIHYQITVRAWQQVGDKDSETSTRDAMASPTMVEVAPGAKRVIRVMKFNPGAASFRVEIREILPKRTEGGVRNAIIYNIPVLFEPAKSQVALIGQRQGSVIVLTNSGSKAAQITAIGAVGAAPSKTGMLGWILPGGSLKLDYAGPGDVALKVNGLPLTVSLR